MPWYEVRVNNERLALIQAEGRNAAERIAAQLNDEYEKDVTVKLADDLED